MKTVLITGATDGIGLETAKMLGKEGHNIIVHGRSESKLANIKGALEAQYPASTFSVVQADLSSFDEVRQFAVQVKAKNKHIDVLINNAGVFSMENPVTAAGLDARFMVNTIAPYMITLALLDVMDAQSRIINVSSAAQAPINLSAFKGETQLSDGAAYAQSKLAITMWTQFLGQKYLNNGPKMVSVNPKSLLGSKMVKSAYGIAGGDLKIGAQVFMDAAFSPRFADVAGEYFDNDHNTFAAPHPFANNPSHVKALIAEMDALIAAH
ncbi:SDR family NAD(P)-dependent oxidoreductase [Alteromonas sp. ALT199]|uniref:SDR family NAD(P)-dependent oxidoreductase n=1 Tax=unclassified Alteromonas TaxID=2614992 RepID=UPI001BE7F407|nr:SDR family NAD(P)-dependent oxidoreductase [Alteromonas sp. ALT199]MBT3134031.1 SDR family NAD(P)-dependent oxidoreductase [Alteromonas sp. ALT199]